MGHVLMPSISSRRRSFSFQTFAGKVVLGVAGARATTTLLGRGQVHAPSLGVGRAVMQSGPKPPVLARCMRRTARESRNAARESPPSRPEPRSCRSPIEAKGEALGASTGQPPGETLSPPAVASHGGARGGGPAYGSVGMFMHVCG